MPSSTSSFDPTTAPRGGQWRRTWLAAVLIAGVVLCGLELFLRANGYKPSVRDSEKLWAHWRHSVRFADSNTVVLLGSSRMLLGFSPAAWREEFPAQHVVQLAINGGSAFPALRDLANDPTFHGTILCELEAWQLIGSAEQAPTQSFVDYYHRAWVSPFQDLECRLRLAVQERFVVTMSGAGYGQALQQLLHGQRPKPKPVFFLRINPDRCFDADYTRVDCRKQEEVHIEKFAEFRAKYAAFSEQDWRAVIQQTRTLAARIEQRGGKIIFVRFPTSGKIRACDEENFPRLRFWNQLTADLHAIHFEDVPTLRTFTCPDGSHLDERDKPAFTRALATELARRQWIQTGKGVVAQSRPVPSAGTGSPD